MPRMQGRPGPPLRDIENLLIEYVLVGREWETYKCCVCDQPFKGDGGQFDLQTGPISLVEYVDRVQAEPERVKSGYGARVADAVRIEAGRDFEYRPGDFSGWACPWHAELINRHWIVMPDA